MSATRQDPRLTALVVLAVLAVGGGLALGFLGVGSQLAEQRTVNVTVLVPDIQEEAARTVKVGDSIFTDAGGMEIGTVIEVDAGPDIISVADAQGELHARENPVRWRVRAVIETTGRQSEDIVAIDNQVVQAGSFFALISRDYYLKGTVVSVDVR